MKSQPMPDPEMEKASIEAFRRGDFLTSEEYLCKLREEIKQRDQRG